MWRAGVNLIFFPVVNCFFSSVYPCYYLYDSESSSQKLWLIPIRLILAGSYPHGQWEWWKMRRSSAGRLPAMKRTGFLGMCTNFCGIRRKRWVVPTLSLLSGGESLKFWYPLENELWIEAWALCVVHWKVCTHWSSPMLDATQFHFQAVIMSPFYGLHSRSYIPFVSDWIHSTPIFCWFNPHQICSHLCCLNPKFLSVKSRFSMVKGHFPMLERYTYTQCVLVNFP